MSYSIDVNGNDNTPEWGYCTTQGCKEAAFPIWLSGGPPDDPDLLLCETHIGLHIAKLETQRKAWTEIGAKAEADAAALRRAMGVLTRVGDAESARSLARGMLERMNAGAALLAELAAARDLKEWTRKWQRDHIISREMIAAMDAMDAARARGK